MHKKFQQVENFRRTLRAVDATLLEVERGGNSLQKTEREKLGKFYSKEKERKGMQYRWCITEQNFEIKFQLEC